MFRRAPLSKSNPPRWGRYDLVDLRLFTTIADLESVTRGAEACNLAPSSASLRIRRLEEAIGSTLFERTQRGVVLTRAGQVMLEHSRRCLAQIEQMHMELAPFSEGMRAQVTLFANSNAIASFIPGDMQHFLRDHKDLRIRMEERLSHDVVSAVASGRADIGVVVWESAHSELEFHTYRTDRLVVVTGSEMRMPRARSISFVDSLNFPFVSLHSGAAIHTFIVGKAATLGRRLDLRIQVAGFPAVVDLVRAGAGIGIVPESILQLRPLDNIRVLELRDDWAIRRLRLCVPADSARVSAPARALLSHLRECSRDGQPGTCSARPGQAER